MCYFLHIHQISAGACAGMCTCDRTHQMKKTTIVSQMLWLVLMRKFRLTMLKWKLSLSIHLPAWPYFSDCDTHKPNKFVMAALNSSQKLATWLLYLGKAKNEGTIDKYNFWNSYQNLYLFYQFVFIINMA